MNADSSGLAGILESLGGRAEIVTEKSEPVEVADKVTATSLAAKLRLSSLEERALSLLGSGCNSESVAAALGVHASRISQLLSDSTFASAVSELRYNNLQRHNSRDNTYDSIEDKLLSKLERSLPLLIKPEAILRAINVVNSAKRRGSSAPEQITNQQNIVTLMMPTVIANKFTVNVNNQVIRAGQQDLHTIDSKSLLSRTQEAAAIALASKEEEYAIHNETRDNISNGAS